MKIRLYKYNKHIQKLKPLLMPVWLKIQKSSLWCKYWCHIGQNRPVRKTHAFCIGLPKSGTHSIATMLECKTAHEPGKSILFDIYLLRDRGLISLEKQIDILKARDALLWLDVESNWLLGLNFEALMKAFPHAKYILTVRSPLSWLNSEINEQFVIGDRIDFFKDIYKTMYGTKSYGQQDIGLAKYGLYSLTGYLSYWKNYHQEILNIVPTKSLLIVKTEEISNKTSQITNFLDVEVNSRNNHSHIRKNKPLKITDLVESRYLNTQIKHYTADITREIERRLNKKQKNS